MGPHILCSKTVNYSISMLTAGFLALLAKKGSWEAPQFFLEELSLGFHWMELILWPSIVSSANRYFLQKKGHCYTEYSPVLIAILPTDFSRLRKCLLCNNLYNQWHPFQNVSSVSDMIKTPPSHPPLPILIEKNIFVVQKFHLETMIFQNEMWL